MMIGKASKIQAGATPKRQRKQQFASQTQELHKLIGDAVQKVQRG